MWCLSYSERRILIGIGCCLCLGSIVRWAGLEFSVPETQQVQSGPQRIPINRATSEQLQSIPGIGPVLAARIISDRRLHGGYSCVRDLQRVKGIGVSKARRMEPFLSFR
ncbi:MAG: hypothetical protein GF333_00085 [Candidatus Omnitrophica bacterium]|nr:hypothetical protein [Candidatus Omnitrophota bacterium]